MLKNLHLLAFLFSLMLFMLSQQLVAQPNLVPNPGFESNSGCPASFTNAFSSVNTWVNSGNTPDYFHPCSASLGVPTNYFGTQPAHGDSAYAGVGVYASSIPDFREYISVQLAQPLLTGHSYHLSFFVSLYDNCQEASNYLGAFVSPQANLNQNDFFSATPQIESAAVISDKNNWIQISGNFIAQGGETYLYLGCFKPDAQLTVVAAGTGSLSSIAYYVDDVSLIDNTGLGVSSLSSSAFQFFPNPADDYINIIDFPNNLSLKLYNSAGENVLTHITPSHANKVSTLGIPEGLYFLTYQLDEMVYSTKIIIRH